MARGQVQVGNDDEKQADDDWLPRINLLKELRETYQKHVPAREEADLARQSVYYLWWRCLKVSEEFVGADVEKTRRDFGELGDDFREWWLRHGRALFAERQMVPVVQVLDVDRDIEPGEYPAWIQVKIPMTISKELIREHLEKILAKYHPGPQLLRHSSSTAKRRLFPRRTYIFEDIEQLVELWLCQQQHPDWDEIQIGEALRIGRQNIVMAADERTLVAEKQRDMRKDVGFKLQQARELMANAVRGEFPRYTTSKRKAKAPSYLP